MMKRLLVVILAITFTGVLMISNVQGETLSDLSPLNVTKDEWIKYFNALPSSITPKTEEPMFINYGTTDNGTLYNWEINDDISLALFCNETTDKVTVVILDLSINENLQEGLLSYITTFNILWRVIFACSPDMAITDLTNIMSDLDISYVYNNFGEEKQSSYDSVGFMLSNNDGKKMSLFVMNRTKTNTK